MVFVLAKKRGLEHCQPRNFHKIGLNLIDRNKITSIDAHVYLEVTIMIPNRVIKTLCSKLCDAFILFILIFLCTQSVYAATPDAGTMLQNFALTVPQLMRLVTALAYVMGMFLIFKGVAALKQYGESRTMMSSQHSLSGPLMSIMIGTALLYLPSSVQVGLNTFWTNHNPYGYVQDTNLDPWTAIIQDGYMIIQLVGTIAFIRGLMMLTHASGQGAQPGAFSKAMAYIISGVLCINLYEFLTVIENTLSLGQT
jgi:intracellular multiplication protein IcmC